ncbi:hypothetical protein ACWDKQ_24200 [Saccharopolyspora sp. NPDC000995]
MIISSEASRSRQRSTVSSKLALSSRTTYGLHRVRRIRKRWWERRIRRFGGGRHPGAIDTPGQMVFAMRLLQGDLACEAEQISLGDVDTASLGCLAVETERFARALRRFGWLAAQR